MGPDGRNRTSLWAFATATGRNAPSNAEFIFGPSKWWRGLVKPPEGRAIAYVDYSAQEIAIAAALSGDPELIKAVESSDPYLAFAHRAGLAPDGATKADSPRDPQHLQDRAAGHELRDGCSGRWPPAPDCRSWRRRALHRQLKRVYDQFQEWSRRVINTGLLRRELINVFRVAGRGGRRDQDDHVAELSRPRRTVPRFCGWRAA